MRVPIMQRDRQRAVERDKEEVQGSSRVDQERGEDRRPVFVLAVEPGQDDPLN